MKSLRLLLPILAFSINFSGRPAAAVADSTTYLSDSTSTKVAAAANNTNMIPWSYSRPLVWDDFLCEPKKEGEAVASTSTSLGLSYQVRDNQLSFHITCDFAKDKSWGALRTDYILAHEQAHFDITELHARRLYEALKRYEFNPVTFKNDIAVIYNTVVREKENMQETYDDETDHSRKKFVQVIWLEKIDNLLDATEIFAKYP